MNIAVQTRRADEEAFADRRIPKEKDWLSREELAALTPEELVRRTTALKPLVATHAAECEALRRPVDAVWNAIRKTGEIGRAHVCTPVTNAHLVCRLLLEQKKNKRRV